MAINLKAKITGSGIDLPDKIVTNSQLENFIGYTHNRQPGWIEERTGIRERRWITENDDQISMAISAADMALCEAGNPTIDTIVVARSRYSDPRSLVLAGAVHNGLRERGHSFSKMVNYLDGFHVCSGSVSALFEASLHISQGVSQSALIVASIIGSEYCSRHHPPTCCLWADGAGAMVVERSDSVGVLAYRGMGIPELWDIFPLKKDEDGKNYIEMNGRAVVKSVMQYGPPLVKQTIEDVGISLDEITLFLFHQANGNMIKRFARELNIPEEKLFFNVDKYGNTSAASTLIAFHEAKKEGRIKKDSLCAFIAFSAGFYINCLIYRAP